jgi:hypothetical protein
MLEKEELEALVATYAETAERELMEDLFNMEDHDAAELDTDSGESTTGA